MRFSMTISGQGERHNGAAAVPKIKSFLRTIPLVVPFLQTEAWKSMRHALTIRFSDRENATYTQSYRSPTQCDALAGPELDYLFAKGGDRPIKIIVLGSSYGAEAFTLATILLSRRPGLIFEIHAYDIDKDVIEKAKKARYTQDEVHDNKMIPDAFLNTIFERDQDSHLVKKMIMENIRR